MPHSKIYLKFSGGFFFFVCTLFVSPTLNGFVIFARTVNKHIKTFLGKLRSTRAIKQQKKLHFEKFYILRNKNMRESAVCKKKLKMTKANEMKWNHRRWFLMIIITIMIDFLKNIKSNMQDVRADRTSHTKIPMN